VPTCKRRPPRSLRWRSSFARSGACVSRRRAGSSRNSSPSRRLRPPSSASARPGRRRKAKSSGSTPRWRRHEPCLRSGMQRSRDSPWNWSRRVCRTRSCDRLARRRTPLSSSYSKRPRPCARPSGQRRSRSRVSCPSRFFACYLHSSRSALSSFAFSLSGLRTGLGTSATQAEALQTAYYSS
jgi:hypothetical protein